MNRKIDDLGRIVVPKEMRDQLGIKNGDSINIELVDNKIVISNPDEVDYKQILEEVRALKDSYNLGKYDYSIPVFEIEQILDKANNE